MQAQNEQVSGLWLAALGPVAVQVRDDAGRVTGRDRGAPDITRAEVPETRHERLPGSDFAFLKRDAAYTILMDAEAEGSVDLKVRVLDKGRNTRTAVYHSAPRSFSYYRASMLAPQDCHGIVMHNPPILA